MNIQQTDNGKKGSFFIEVNNKIVAEMSYVWVGETKIIIDHTEVDTSLKGKGAGMQMVKQAVDFARTKQIKIIPLCPFARSVFDKIKEFNDVI